MAMSVSLHSRRDSIAFFSGDRYENLPTEQPYCRKFVNLSIVDSSERAGSAHVDECVAIAMISLRLQHLFRHGR